MFNKKLKYYFFALSMIGTSANILLAKEVPQGKEHLYIYNKTDKDIHCSIDIKDGQVIDGETIKKESKWSIKSNTTYNCYRSTNCVIYCHYVGDTFEGSGEDMTQTWMLNDNDVVPVKDDKHKLEIIDHK